MRLNELSAFLERELTYPIERNDVVARIGEIELESPSDEREPQTVGMALSDVDTNEPYESVEDLFQTIVGNVDDAYIGRKFYDDRGSNPGEPRETTSF